MTDDLTVQHLGGDCFRIDVRGHTLTVDQPIEDGGDDTAPTPTELFVASVAGCIAHYARRYLARHHLSAEGLAVSASYGIAPRPARVGRLDVRITPPDSLPDERRDAFLAVASHCTVHNTLEHPPMVAIALD